MNGNVKGILFVDYVRMIRACKHVAWTDRLEPDDWALVAGRIQPDQWYPMDVFERLGEAILEQIAGGDMETVRLWGRASVDPVLEATPAILAADDPIDTLMRFRIHRNTFFDFDALALPTIIDGEANVEVEYRMGPVAEEAASYQTMGFMERLVERAGATVVKARFLERSWARERRTLIELRWM